MRAHLYLLAGLVIAGAGLACDSSSSDADPRLACLYIGGGTCLPDEPDEPDESDESACGYRTETQTTWGAECKGNAPACLRDDHFSELFPEGLYIGCGEYTANVLSAAAIEAALATTGSPRPLLKSEAVAYDGAGDPVVGTALFGEAVALSLNVGFDAVPGFTDDEPAVPLADLVLASGPCAGMNVAQVLEEANLVLGGCPSALTPANAAACVTAINTSFVKPDDTCDDDDDNKKNRKDDTCDDDDDNKKNRKDECEEAPVCSDLFESP